MSSLKPSAPSIVTVRSSEITKLLLPAVTLAVVVSDEIVAVPVAGTRVRCACAVNGVPGVLAVRVIVPSRVYAAVTMFCRLVSALMPATKASASSACVVLAVV